MQILSAMGIIVPRDAKFALDFSTISKKIEFIEADNPEAAIELWQKYRYFDQVVVVNGFEQVGKLQAMFEELAAADKTVIWGEILFLGDDEDTLQEMKFIADNIADSSIIPNGGIEWMREIVPWVNGDFDQSKPSLDMTYSKLINPGSLHVVEINVQGKPPFVVMGKNLKTQKEVELGRFVSQFAAEWAIERKDVRQSIEEDSLEYWHDYGFDL